ncbi:anti-sigma B factor antagonist [Streptomyces sp. V4I23]|uniref:STAS domain-containing protein n=1 Tax=Streptomyces sp. V4I23 TaxID=3042282 RepID=UPI00278ACC3C|nr:STAS domain-containing protein [Streptomyces sp. V4I23]MDQ1006160.1 anti-sigma B factor antagonist [Streptomyces sp. V4I23]
MYDVTMQVELTATGPDSCRMTMAGELDVVTAPGVRQALRAAVAEYQHIVVDLGKVHFCDCTGVSALLAGARAARAHDVDLCLRAVPCSLARILRLSGSGGAFTIEPVQPVRRPASDPGGERRGPGDGTDQGP